MLALPVAACSNSYSDLPIATAGSAERYTLGAGDSIKVAVYGFDAMAGSYTVSDAGTISLPMLSTIRVVGKSAPELETEIAGVLRTRDLAPNANVSVQVEKYRPFFILGQVQRPGQYPYVPGMTVLTAVAIAGGYTFRADKRAVVVNRSNGGAAAKARLNPDSVIMPGDTVEIPEAWF